MSDLRESVRFADDYQRFFNECFLMNERLNLKKDHYSANLSFLFSVFDSMSESDFYSIADKKKFTSELITSIKEYQSCISKLSAKIQQLANLTDDDYTASAS